MPKQLTTQNATITTAAVEVKTLTISGKQVTQSVFRQLREEGLIDHEGTLHGIPWGYVNYCPDRKVWDSTQQATVVCAEGLPHLHVIWQKNNELRRARVTAPPIWWPDFDGDECDYFIQAAYCANGHTLPEGTRYAWRHGGEEIRFRFDGINCSTVPPHRAADHDCCAGEVDEAKTQLSTAITAEQARRGRHRTGWAELLALPQLFIAV